jgi:hypothetical protein
MSKRQEPSPAAIDRQFNRLKQLGTTKLLDSDRLFTIAEFLCKLGNLTESSDGWSAQCPAHPDSQNSLSTRVTQDGKILVYCHRGCSFSEVVEAAGMLEQEMFSSNPTIRRAILPPRQPLVAKPELTAAVPVLERHQLAFCDEKFNCKIQELADQLGVTFDSLDAIGVGWNDDLICWTFPEFNGEGQLCGILQRFTNGRKTMVPGGHRGLTLPAGWDKGSDILHICEGASDVAAALSHGWRAIGRSAATAGFGDLAVLLRDVQTEVVIVADNDEPGLKGAQRLADQLRNVLHRKVKVSRPEDQFKDLREYLSQGVIR